MLQVQVKLGKCFKFINFSRDLECVSSAQWELQVVRHCRTKTKLIWRLAVNNKLAEPRRGVRRSRESSSAAP